MAMAMDTILPRILLLLKVTIVLASFPAGHVAGHGQSSAAEIDATGSKSMNIRNEPLIHGSQSHIEDTKLTGGDDPALPNRKFEANGMNYSDATGEYLQAIYDDDPDDDDTRASPARRMKQMITNWLQPHQPRTLDFSGVFQGFSSFFTTIFEFLGLFFRLITGGNGTGANEVISSNPFDAGQPPSNELDDYNGEDPFHVIEVHHDEVTPNQDAVVTEDDEDGLVVFADDSEVPPAETDDEVKQQGNGDPEKQPGVETNDDQSEKHPIIMPTGYPQQDAVVIDLATTPNLTQQEWDVVKRVQQLVAQQNIQNSQKADGAEN